MTTQQLLENAAKRVERGWCQKAFAKNIDGVIVDPQNPSAVAWCMVGSIAAEEPSPFDIQKALHKTGTILQGDGVDNRSALGWNDAPSRTKKEVVSVLKRASRIRD